MKEPRIYWGDIRLWRFGRAVVVKESRGSIQVYEGIDALNALVLPTSPNYMTDLECHTFWDPAVDASGDYTRLSMRSVYDKMVSELTLRAGTRAPVCWIEDSSDTTINRTVTAVAGSTLTVGSNSFANNDWVLVRRLGSGLWTLSQVSGRTSTTIDVTLTHSAAINDTVMLVSQFWKNMVFQDLAPAGLNKEGGHFYEDAVFSFKGYCPSSARYQRMSVNLDA